MAEPATLVPELKAELPFVLCDRDLDIATRAGHLRPTDDGSWPSDAIDLVDLAKVAADQVGERSGRNEIGVHVGIHPFIMAALRHISQSEAQYPQMVIPHSA